MQIFRGSVTETTAEKEDACFFYCGPAYLLVSTFDCFPSVILEQIFQKRQYFSIYRMF